MVICDITSDGDTLAIGTISDIIIDGDSIASGTFDVIRNDVQLFRYVSGTWFKRRL